METLPPSLTKPLLLVVSFGLVGALKTEATAPLSKQHPKLLEPDAGPQRAVRFAGAIFGSFCFWSSRWLRKPCWAEQTKAKENRHTLGPWGLTVWREPVKPSEPGGEGVCEGPGAERGARAGARRLPSLSLPSDPGVRPPVFSIPSPSHRTSPVSNLPAREEVLAGFANLSLESHNISLTGQSGVAVEKNITLQRPSTVELMCLFTTPRDPSSVRVTWRKGDQLLEGADPVSAAGGALWARYRFTIINSQQMGSYSCFFQDETEQRGTFNFKVPELHGKNKPLVTYVGDSTVLICKCEGCFPLNWTWYSSNGSAQVPLAGQTSGKYVINGTHANETRLKITQLSEEDQGAYRCRALFHLGASEDRVELVVLSYLVPLKPFLAIAAEALLLVAVILLCEMYTQKKKGRPDDGKEFEQIEQLKSDDSNGIENNVPRYRKTE